MAPSDILIKGFNNLRQVYTQCMLVRSFLCYSTSFFLIPNKKRLSNQNDEIIKIMIHINY